MPLDTPPRPPGAPSGPTERAPARSASGSAAFARATPTAIGRYRIDGELGRGGMGVVYRAFDPQLARAVAIKMLRAGPWNDDRERFVREARTAARLSHPGIVGVHDVGDHEGNPYLAMDLVEGESLAALMARELPSPRRLAEIVGDVARALAHAHERGVVHRDIKPENILIDADGRPRITDFGLARDLTAKQQLTQTGEVLGTPTYMAPEQADRGRGPIGPATDGWALGVLLYHGLTGRLPFEAAGGPLAVIARVLHDEPAPPSAIAPRVQADLATIAMRCMEKEPARRYASAAAVADELDRFGRGEAILARPPTLRERGRSFVRRRPVVALGLGLALLALLALPALAVGSAVRASRGHAREVRETREALERATAGFRSAYAKASGPRTRTGWLAAKRDFSRHAVVAIRAIERQRALSPDDPAVEAAGSAIALEIGDAALVMLDYQLASFCYERGLELAPDSAAAQQRTTAIARMLETDPMRSRTIVRETLEDASAGRIPEGAACRQAALALAGRSRAWTGHYFHRTLDEVARALRAATARAVRESLEAPDLAAVDEALEPWTEDLAIAMTEPIRAAIEQTILRLGGTRALGRRQRELVGDGPLTAARLACEALGAGDDMKTRSIGSIASCLAASYDERLGEAAGVALARLTGAREPRLLLEVAVRFGVESPAWLAVCEALRERGEMPTAEEVRDPLERGYLLLGMGALDAAALALDAAADDEPSRAPALVGRAEVHWRSGRHEAALADLEHAARLVPDDPVVRITRARTLEAMGRPEEALAELDRLGSIGDRLAQVQSARARAHGALGAYAEALAAIDRAIALGPRRPAYWQLRARFRRALGDPEGAVADATRAIELDPALAEAWAWRGLIHKDRGRDAEAIRDLDEAIARDPGSADALTWRGNAHLQAGHLDEAIADHGRVIELRPDSPTGYFNRALALRERLDLDAALADLDRAIELSSRYGEALGLRALVRSQLGALAEAVADATRALELAPTHRMVTYWSAQVLRRARRLDEALRCAERAIEIAPRDSERYFIRGLVQEDRGDLEAARADYERAISLAGDEGLGARYRERLDLVRQRQRAGGGD